MIAGVKYGDKVATENSKNATRGEGGLIVEKDTVVDTQKKKTEVKFLENLSKITGANIHVFSSSKDDYGDYSWTDENDIVHKQNGWFATNTGEIWIDLNAGVRGEGIALYTASHELVHYMAQNNPVQYREMAKWLFEQYGKKGIPKASKSIGLLDEYVRQQLASAKANGQSISLETAYEEVVASACETMLVDGDLATKLQDAKGSWVKTVVNWLKKFVNKIKKWYLGLNPSSAEAQTTREIYGIFEGLLERFEAGLVGLAEMKVRPRDNGKSNGETKNQARNVESVGKKKYTKHSTYDEFNTLALQWAHHPSTMIGESRILPKGSGFVIITATVDGYVENEKGSYRKVVDKYEQCYRKSEGSLYRHLEEFRSAGNANSRDLLHDRNLRRNDENGGQNGEEELQGDATGSGKHLLSSSSGIEGQENKKFQLRGKVETVGELVAVHNLTEEKLLKSLQLGGFPMPSIAVLKAQDGHENFGSISLVFHKETIDPQFFRSNKVYSGDAYTPTYPRIDYKVNDKVQEDIEKKINKLISYDVARGLGGLHIDTDNITSELNRNNGSIVKAFGNNMALKYAFLVENGTQPELPTRNKSLAKYSNHPDNAIIRVAETVPQEKLSGILREYTSEQVYEVEPEIRKAVNEYIQQKYDKLPLKAKEGLLKTEPLSRGDIDDYAREALDYLKNGVTQEIDYYKSRTLINESVDAQQYENWLNELFSNIVEKEGIRNNKDIFTPSGNRRGFEALHYEHNLENVIKAMKESGAKGVGAFGGGNIFGAATTEFSSIEDIRGSKERLQTLSDSEFDEIKKGFSDRFFELASSLPKHKDSFTATDDAANMLVEAVLKFKTKSGMANYIRSECEGWANYSEYVVDDLIQLVQDIQNMPTEYFEAKPQRAVGLDEVAFIIAPDNISAELKSALKESGIEVKTYEAGNESQRKALLNSDNNIKFQYRNAPVNTELLSMVDNVENKRFKANDKVYFKNVSDDIAEKIQDLTGIDVTGFKMAIEARMVEHILKDHGPKGLANKSMANPDDIAKMEFALSFPDNISFSGTTDAYTNMINGKNRLAKTVLYEKNIGDKSYYVVQAVPDTNAKTLYVVSAFIGQKGYKNKASQLPNANSPGATSEIESANASKESILPENNSVKSQLRTSYTEDILLTAEPKGSAEARNLAEYRKYHELGEGFRKQLAEYNEQLKADPNNQTIKGEIVKTKNRITIADNGAARAEQNLRNLIEREAVRSILANTNVGATELAKGRRIYREAMKQGTVSAKV